MPGKPTLDIGINQDVYDIFKSLNYKPWTALAEFVDNAIQSGTDHGISPVRIEIELTPDAIVISDNAGGISDHAMEKAFSVGKRKNQSEKLGEFGMGLKTAACWFSALWSVTTTAIGEEIQKTILFDVNAVVACKNKTLPINRTEAKSVSQHGTRIKLQKLHQSITSGPTKEKIKTHLASIYSNFLSDHAVEIIVFGKKLEPPKRHILIARPANDESGDSKPWIQKEAFIWSPTPNKNYSISYTAWLSEKLQNKPYGIKMFRRNRMVKGFDGEACVPQEIFGALGGHKAKRARIDLELDPKTPVAHTKDGIPWQENEEEHLYKILREKLKALLSQAANYRLPSEEIPSIKPQVFKLVRGQKVNKIINSSDNTNNWTAKLPKGLRLDKPTGTISGIPEESGEFNVEVQVHNEFGTNQANVVFVIKDTEESNTADENTSNKNVGHAENRDLDLDKVYVHEIDGAKIYLSFPKNTNIDIKLEGPTKLNLCIGRESNLFKSIIENAKNAEAAIDITRKLTYLIACPTMELVLLSEAIYPEQYLNKIETYARNNI